MQRRERLVLAALVVTTSVGCGNTNPPHEDTGPSSDAAPPAGSTQEFVVASCSVCDQLASCFDAPVTSSCSGTQCSINTNGAFVGLTDRCQSAILQSLRVAGDESKCTAPSNAEFKECYGSPSVPVSTHPGASSGAVALTDGDRSTIVHIDQMELWEMRSNNTARRLSYGVTWLQRFQTSSEKLFGTPFPDEPMPKESTAGGWDLLVPPKGQIIHFGPPAKPLDPDALFSFTVVRFSGANVMVQAVTDRRRDVNNSTSETVPCWMDSDRPNCEFSLSGWACDSGTVHTANVAGKCDFTWTQEAPTTSPPVAMTAVSGKFTSDVPSQGTVGQTFDLTWTASQIPINLKLTKGNGGSIDIAPSAGLAKSGSYRGVTINADWIPTAAVRLLVNGVETDSRTIEVGEAPSMMSPPSAPTEWQFSVTWDTWSSGGIAVYRKNPSVFNLLHTANSGPTFAFAVGAGQFSSSDQLTIQSAAGNSWMCNNTGLHGSVYVVDLNQRIWTGHAVSNNNGGCDVGFQ